MWLHYWKVRKGRQTNYFLSNSILSKIILLLKKELKKVFLKKSAYFWRSPFKYRDLCGECKELPGAQTTWPWVILKLDWMEFNWTSEKSKTSLHWPYKLHRTHSPPSPCSLQTSHSPSEPWTISQTPQPTKIHQPSKPTVPYEPSQTPLPSQTPEP